MSSSPARPVTKCAVPGCGGRWTSTGGTDKGNRHHHEAGVKHKKAILRQQQLHLQQLQQAAEVIVPATALDMILQYDSDDVVVVHEQPESIAAAAIMQALQRGGTIYEYIKREHGATLKITKALARELKSLKIKGNIKSLKITKIEWTT